jgi:hypothetical protein
MRILVLSSHTKPSSTGPINHQAYCLRHNYDYLFDATPYPLSSPYDQKLQSIIHNLHKADWVMWLDHDAYFMNHQVKLESFLDSESDFIFCNSPVTPSGDWTVLNSGVFFVRNTPFSRSLLIEALNTNIQTVREWWQKEKQGLFTNSEQDRLVYQFTTKDLLGTKVRIVEYTLFNARTSDFHQRPDEKFIVHFCGFGDKAFPMLRFQKKFGLDQFLLQNNPKPEYRWSVFYEKPKTPVALFINNVSKRLSKKMQRLVPKRMPSVK